MSQGFGRHHSLIIPEYADRFPAHRVLVETGTGEIAETTAKMAPLFDLVFTIDIDSETATYALNKFRDDPNVIPICGDSEEILPLLVNTIGRPCLFFLDAHWDHDIPRRRGHRDTPVESELNVILPSYYRHIVLMDDARFFLDGEYRDVEYPAYEWVEKQASAHDYKCTVEDDVIRLVPAS